MYWHGAARTWLVTPYDNVDFVLRSSKLFSDHGFQGLLRKLSHELRAAAMMRYHLGMASRLKTCEVPRGGVIAIIEELTGWSLGGTVSVQ